MSTEETPIIITYPHDSLWEYFPKHPMDGKMYIIEFSRNEEEIDNFSKAMESVWNNSPYARGGVLVQNLDDAVSTVKKRANKLKTYKKGSEERRLFGLGLTVDIFFFSAAIAGGWRASFKEYGGAYAYVACTDEWDPMDALKDAQAYIAKKLEQASKIHGNTKNGVEK